MLEIVRALFRRLNKEEIPYCHWKSNCRLPEAVRGEGDLDILVERAKSSECEALLVLLGFKRAVPLLFEAPESVAHHYALDENTGSLVHVHLYYKIVTGESLVKNFCLPVEKMLLEDTRLMDCVKVPSKEAELALFLLRMMLKQMPLIENVLFLRDYKNVREELLWLSDNFSREKFLLLVHQWFPAIEDKMFFKCMEVLSGKQYVAARIVYAIKIRRKLRPYMRRGIFSASVMAYAHAAHRLFNKVFVKRKPMMLASGGRRIAFIGPPASGKSTVAEAVVKWLGNEFEAYRVHAGKPPSTCLTCIPNVFLPLARKLFPNQRAIVYENAAGTETADRSFLHVLRMVLLSYDRKSLLMKYYRKSQNGALVIFDRYPSRTAGAVDSSAFTDAQIRTTRGLKSFLMTLERRMYESIPPPDIVVHLTVPVETALCRDQTRDKPDAGDPDYIRQRHNPDREPAFPGVPQKEISTAEALQKTERDIKKFIWTHL